MAAVTTSPATAQSFFGPRGFLQTSRGTQIMGWAGGGGFIYGNSPNRLAWEELEIWDLNGGRLEHGDVIGLRTSVSHHFVSDDGGGGPATADRTWCQGWEQFVIVREAGPGVLNSGDKLFLKGWHGQWLGPRYDLNGWQVGCWFDWNPPPPGGWEELTWIDRDDSSVNRSNCVFYARSRVPSLPHGLDTLAGKRSTINTYKPSPGSVAVMDIDGDVGHLAVVEQVHDDGTITVREGNYHAGTINARRESPGSMRVIGYYHP